jgi:hypothetical protein
MLRFAALLCLLVISSGCTREWFLTVQPAADGNVELCFSSSDGCRGDGVQFASLQIARVDTEGHPGEVVWSLQGHSNVPSEYILKRVTYGHPPPGWVEVHAPIPIAENVYYSVAGEFFFERTGARKFHVYPREEFFSRIVNRQK